jgi:phosphoserine phosphatase
MKVLGSIYQVLFLILALLNSCATAYIPNTVNTPLLTNRKEFQAAIYAGTSGFDPQLTYAVSDHIGIMLNGSFANVTSDSTIR